MTAKMAALKKQLEKNVKLELTRVENECEMMLYGAGSVYNLSKKSRRQYRNLVVYRQEMRENLNTVKGWTVDQFVKALHVDNSVHAWLGWN